MGVLRVWGRGWSITVRVFGPALVASLALPGGLVAAGTEPAREASPESRQAAYEASLGGACSRDREGVQHIEKQGYWLVGRDGGVFNFGQAPFLGSAVGMSAAPVVGIEHVGGLGYLVGSAEGGVIPFGDATFHGGADHTPVTALVSDDASGSGYRMLAVDGAITHLGSERGSGDLAGSALNAPVVDIAAAAHIGNDDYWVVARDGGVFAFGDGAGFYGSAADRKLDSPVVGIAGHPNGKGYWLVTEDGAVLPFGLPFLGQPKGHPDLRSPVVGIEPAGQARGYWVVTADGTVFAYGDATFFGDARAIKLNAPVVGMAVCKGPGRSFGQP